MVSIINNVIKFTIKVLPSLNPTTVLPSLNPTTVLPSSNPSTVLPRLNPTKVLPYVNTPTVLPYLNPTNFHAIPFCVLTLVTGGSKQDWYGHGWRPRWVYSDSFKFLWYCRPEANVWSRTIHGSWVSRNHSWSPRTNGKNCPWLCPTAGGEDLVLTVNQGRKEVFYLTTHSTHFIYGYMVSGMW